MTSDNIRGEEKVLSGIQVLYLMIVSNRQIHGDNKSYLDIMQKKKKKDNFIPVVLYLLVKWSMF